MASRLRRGGIFFGIYAHRGEVDDGVGFPVGILRLYKCKVVKPVVLGSLSGLSNNPRLSNGSVIEKFENYEDIRRARDTAMLSMMECAKAWRNVGGEQGSTLVCACQSLLERHLKLTGHSLAVCKQHYQQYGSVEVSQIHTDAKRIKARGFKQPALWSGDSLESSVQKYLRLTGG